MASELAGLAGARPSCICLYDEGTCAVLRAEEVGAWLEDITGIQVELRGPFLQVAPPGAVSRAPVGRGFHPAPEVAGHGSPALQRKDVDALAHRLAQLRVTDPSKPRQDRAPLPMEVRAERRTLTEEGYVIRGVLYDGFALSALLADPLWTGEAASPTDPTGEAACPTGLHLVITARLIGTWDTGDLRWHARTSVYSRVSIISTTGLVQAPARPREYYTALAALSRAAPRELVEAQLKAEFKGRFLADDDERITEVLKGYALQALLYDLTGEPFCPRPSCRLYNAHWQEEMLRAQLEGPELCPQHQRLMAALRAAV